MRQKTVAEKRAEAVVTLAKRKTENPTAKDIADARRTMNSFYRLCGLRETQVNFDNDAYRYNLLISQQLEAREDRWYERLKGIFESKYNATLIYYGYLPTICELDAEGHRHDLNLVHFYQ